MIPIAVPDLLEPIVSALAFSTTTESYSYDNVTNTTKIELCCTAHLRPCSNVYVNGVKYSILGIVVNKYILIKGNLNLTGVVEVKADAPFYFHGTITTTGADITRINRGHDKYPMVYLYEPITEVFFNDATSYEREAELRIFFLDESNFGDWKTDDHYYYAINQMRYLAFKFIEKINKTGCTFGEVTDSYRIISHAKIGTEITEKTHVKNLFSDFLSGVELIINLKIKRQKGCKPCTC